MNEPLLLPPAPPPGEPRTSAPLTASPAATATPKPKSARKPWDDASITYVVQAVLLFVIVAGTCVFSLQYLMRPSPGSPTVKLTETRVKPPPPQPVKVQAPPEGYREIQSLPIRARRGEFNMGVTPLTELGGFWFGNDQMLASQTKKNDWVEFEVPELKPGKYQLSVFMTRVWFYGIVQVSWNGKPVGKPVDLFSPRTVETTGEVPLGTIRATEKDPNLIRFEVVDRNSGNQAPHYEFGIDGIRLIDAD